MLVPSAIKFPVPQAQPDDPRLKNVIKSGAVENPHLTLLGVPYDGGIANGGGRLGAADGPEAFRQALLSHASAYNFDHECDLTALRISDAGNVAIANNDIHAVHRSASDAVMAIVLTGAVPFVVGGGHDLTFAHVRGLAEAVGGTVGGINIDGHLDVRPTLDNRPSSGTPFRRLIEELPNFRSDCFVEFGVHGHLAAKQHVEYLRGKGSTLMSLSDIRRRGVAVALEEALAIAAKADRLFVSFDIDSVAQAFAPGCSAPSPDGFFPADVELIAFLAGCHPKMKLLDLLELSPPFDIDSRTSRLAVSYFAHALTGVSVRDF